MSTQDSDGIDEALQGLTHVAMTTAARVGEQLARAREQQLRAAQTQSEQAARELAARLDAERHAARAQLASVHQSQWWDNARPDEVARAYETARTWSDVDPEAVRAEQRITQEVRDRHGIELSGDARGVGDAISRADLARDQAAQERTHARRDRAEATGLMVNAEAADRAAEAEAVGADVDREPARELEERAGHAYDSAERREALAQDLDHIENDQAVEARVRSDVAQAKPATQAVKTSPRTAPQARKTRGKGQGVKVARDQGRGR